MRGTWNHIMQIYHYENSNKLLLLLVKSLKVKFLHQNAIVSFFFDKVSRLTAGTEIDVILLQITSYLQNFKQT